MGETMKTHWETIYKAKTPVEVSWYQPHLTQSLALVERAGLAPDDPIIDVGSGVSTFVDDVLTKGFTQVTVLDLSGNALAVAKARLGAQAAKVTWIEADVTQVQLPAHRYALWHDRAIFHFLTDAEARRRYVQVLQGALRPGGHVILATFSMEGPPRCSGLEVVRYSPDTLQAELGPGFRLQETVQEEHRTPGGMTQAFLYCRFQQ